MKLKYFIHSLAVFVFSFSASLHAQTDHSIATALECKTLSLPQFRPWETFSAGDLPISDANSWNATEIVSKTTSQGDDGNTVEVRYKNPVSVFGGSVSAALITTDIFGAQQTALVEVSNFDLFKESIEKQLSFKFSLDQEKYNYFNPSNGMEYQISKANEGQSFYYYSCGLNKDRYQDALANPDKYKSPQELEKEKAAKEEQKKKIDAFLLQNNKVFKQFIEQTEWTTTYGPIMGLVIGFLTLIAGSGFLYLHFKNKAENKNTKFIIGTSASAIGLVLTGLSIFQYIHPIFAVDSTSVETAWLQTAEHVRNDDRYIKTFLNAGKLLANEGSVKAAKELAFIYAGGSDVVEKNSKLAQYYANLFEVSGKLIDKITKPTSIAKNEGNTANSPKTNDSVNSSSDRSPFEFFLGKSNKIKDTETAEMDAILAKVRAGESFIKPSEDTSISILQDDFGKYEGCVLSLRSFDEKLKMYVHSNYSLHVQFGKHVDGYVLTKNMLSESAGKVILSIDGDEYDLDKVLKNGDRAIKLKSSIIDKLRSGQSAYTLSGKVANTEYKNVYSLRNFDKAYRFALQVCPM